MVKWNYKDTDKIRIIENEIQMELASYDIFKLIENKKTKNNLNICINIWNSINKALEYMHSIGYVHQDIKPENILVFEKEELIYKLCDFGCSDNVKKDFNKDNGLINININGTCLYWSPEKVNSIVNNDKYINAFKEDNYELELTILLAWTYYFPYENRYKFYKNMNNKKNINKDMSIIWNEPLKKFKIPKQLKDIFKYLK